MVLTAAQVTLFFEDAAHMAIPANTRAQLQQEGIITVEDLSDFDVSELKQIAENLRKPAGRIPDPAAGAVGGPPLGATVPTPPFVFGAKSQLRLKAASNIVRYYETVGRVLTPSMIRWGTEIKVFNQHWTTLVTRKDEDKPEVPKITKGLPVTKWSEAFRDFLGRYVGIRFIPLVYVVRILVDVPVVPPPLMNNQPYSIVHGSVEDELIARASHDHANYRDDTATVYYCLEEATRGTSYAGSIKPFQRRRDGRGAFLAIVNQYAGNDKWQAELTKQDDLLHTRIWKGQSNFPLERFVAQHRNAYISMSQCAEHVPFQLPNQQTRVTYLLDGINCDFAPLQAAMALVRNDAGPNGKLNNFEDTASYILPHDPVLKKRNKSQRDEFNVSDVTSDDKKGNLRSGLGEKTGVPLRFHTKEEYSKLTTEEKSELREHRDVLQRQGKGRKLDGVDDKKDKLNGYSNKRLKSMISEVLASESKKADSDTNQEDELRKYILSVVNSKSTPSDDTASAAASSLTTATTPLTPTPPQTITNILKSHLKGNI